MSGNFTKLCEGNREKVKEIHFLKSVATLYSGLHICKASRFDSNSQPNQKLFLISAPLVNLKKAISIVKGDIVSMDVKLGVLEHNLLKARLRDKTMSQNYVNADALFVS